MDHVRGDGGGRDDLVREVLDALPRAIVVSDADGAIVLWNAVAEELYGWSEAEALGRLSCELVGTPAPAARPSGRHEEDRRVVRRDGTEVWVLVLSQPIGDGHGGLRALVEASEDVSERRALERSAASASRENRALRDLQDRVQQIDAATAVAARKLAGARNLAAVVRIMQDDLPPVLGAGSVEVGLLLDAEHLSLVDPGLDGRAVTYAKVALSGTEPSAEAARTGVTTLVEGPGAAAVASPLFDDAMHPVGVVTFSWDEARLFDDIDRTAVETASRLVGQALRRTQIAEQAEAIAGLAAALATARTRADVARVLQEHAVAAAGCTVVTLRELDRETATLVAVVPAAVAPELADRYQVVPIDGPFPMSEAARTDRPVWIPGHDEYARRFPAIAADARSAGLGAAAALPFHNSDGEVAGVLNFAWPAAMELREPLRATLLTVTDLVSQTYERTQLHEAEHAVVMDLQRQLLAPLPEVAGLELAAYYEPAAGSVGMGGDWYEALELADGSLIAVIGDVVGHGVGAVAAMAKLQHLVAGLIQAGTPLGEVLASAGAMTIGTERIFATAQLLHVDLARGRLGYLNAAHPWALVRDPDGSVRRLSGRHLSMLGTPLEPHDLEYVPLAPGALVLGYTDGLIERRSEGIVESIDRLAGCLAGLELGPSLTGSLEALVRRVTATGDASNATNDDAAALLIRVR